MVDLMSEYDPDFNKKTPIMPHLSDMMPGTLSLDADPYGTSRNVVYTMVTPTVSTDQRTGILALFSLPKKKKKKT